MTPRSKFIAMAATVASFSVGGVLAANAIAEDPASLAAAPTYSSFEARGTGPTSRVSEMAGVLAKTSPTIDRGAIRGLKAPDGTQTWFIPGKNDVCFGADNSDGTGYACATKAEAEAGVISVAEGRRDGTARVISLVPDEVVSVDYSGKRYAPKNNVVVATNVLRDADIRATTADGTVLRVGR